jgi:hypothetical protein
LDYFGHFPPQDSLFSSNQQESIAVHLPLIESLPILQVNHIRFLLFQSDNMTTFCNLTRQAAALSLLKASQSFPSILLKTDIRIHAKNIPGITNTIADNLSRLSLSGGYEISDQAYHKGISALGVFSTADCFASVKNRKCFRFLSPQVDGLSQPWYSEIFTYLHPPTSLIPRVLRKIVYEQITAVAVILPGQITRGGSCSVH